MTPFRDNKEVGHLHLASQFVLLSIKRSNVYILFFINTKLQRDDLMLRIRGKEIKIQAA